jgi:hypothetical protein
MRLESTAIALRRREPWEAIDLGFAMLRQWWRPVYAAWAVTFLPVAGALLLVFHEEPWIAGLILWWLKPVFDRIVLHVLSRAVFGEAIPVRRLLPAWREYLWPGLIAGQLWGRVDLARSFDLPVWQLERESGRAAVRRRSVLQKRARYHAVWLTAMCANFEAVMILGQMLLAELATPAKASTGWLFEQLSRSGGEGGGPGLEVVLAYAVAITAIEPFYVAGGFALYLNRRTLLEGWDIELALRRCTARFAGTKALAAAVLLTLVAWLALPQPVTAAEAGAEKSAKAEIAEVLKGPEFPHDRERSTWRVRWPEREWPDWEWPEWLKFRSEPDDAKSDTGWPLGEILGTLAKIVLWTAAAVGIVWLAYHLARLLPRLIEPMARAEPPPVLFGLEIAPESLPPDIAAVAAQLLAEGRVREALSLLYRGALSSLVHKKGVEFHVGDTERDCLRRAMPVLPREGHTYFGELIAAWEAAAYAGRLPDAARASGLVASWTGHFAKDEA